MIEAPKPGLYRDVPSEVYHSWDAVSASLLADLRRFPPAQVRWNMLHPSAPTPAMRFGSALHAALLEPDTFDERYVRAPDVDRRTKAGKEAWAAVEAEGRTVLSFDDMIRIDGMRSAAMAHPIVRRLLEGVGVNEASLVWQDPIHDLPCKLRVDRLVQLDGRSFVIDFKSTADVSPAAFSRTIENLAYHIRAAWYLRGLREVATAEREYLWIAQDKGEPYLPAVYQIDPDDLAEGAGDCARLLAFYAHCRASDVWPGYTEDQAEICQRPRWARRAPESEADETRGRETYDEGSW